MKIGAGWCAGEDTPATAGPETGPETGATGLFSGQIRLADVHGDERGMLDVGGHKLEADSVGAPAADAQFDRGGNHGRVIEPVGSLQAHPDSRSQRPPLFRE